MTSKIIEYYSKSFYEDMRLQVDSGGIIEWIRTIDILERFLPPAPATILDIGGGTVVFILSGYLKKAMKLTWLI